MRSGLGRIQNISTDPTVHLSKSMHWPNFCGRCQIAVQCGAGTCKRKHQWAERKLEKCNTPQITPPLYRGASEVRIVESCKHARSKSHVHKRANVVCDSCSPRVKYPPRNPEWNLLPAPLHIDCGPPATCLAGELANGVSTPTDNGDSVGIREYSNWCNWCHQCFNLAPSIRNWLNRWPRPDHQAVKSPWCRSHNMGPWMPTVC